MEAIREHGLSGLSVEALARDLNVTKGSFYWHFKSRDALIEAALARWEQIEREQVFEPIDSLSNSRERIVDLFHRVGERSPLHMLFSQLVRAVDHPLAGPVIARVSKRRMDWVALTFRQMGLERNEAQHRARLAYAAYVGFLQLTSHEPTLRLDDETFEEYLKHAMATLIP